MKKVITIIGGGASGVAAALGFVKKGIIPTIIDVGKRNSGNHNTEGNLYDYRRENDLFDLMIGDEMEGLSNIIEGTNLPPKLNNPMNKYVTSGAKDLSPIESSNFNAIQSFAAGGLASAWGAGLYRYNDSDLKEVPLNSQELEPFYNILSKEIGISGTNDDLIPFFGNDNTLLPPVKLSKKSDYIYKNYQRKKNKLNRKGIFVGHPRMAVLTSDLNKRKQCDYSNFDIWLNNIPWIYNPVQTLDRLIKEKKVIYKPGIHIDSWKRNGEGLIILGKNTSDNSPFQEKTNTLVLAAGTINTAKIILKSKQDNKTKLRIIDNNLYQIPLVIPAFFGSVIEKTTLGMTNLNLVYNSPDGGPTLQGSIIELTSLPRSVFFDRIPVSSVMNLNMIKMTSPSFLAMFLYFPSSYRDGGFIRLAGNNNLQIGHKDYFPEKKQIRNIIRALFSMGAWTHPLLIQQSKPGYAIHYAGTIPMKEKTTSDYESSMDGRLHREKGVYVADGSPFSEIAAKNLSFTLMANAMRIADRISEKK